MKWKKLLKKINSLDKRDIFEIREDIIENRDFLKFLEKNKKWSDEEHDGLLKLLDLHKNETGYYLDIYGRPVSYNGIRTLKKTKTELPLYRAHEIEQEKCKDDFLYFRQYYCFIMTKTGLARPEPRNYQQKLENKLISLEDVVILFSRQSGKTVTVGTYLLWLSLYKDLPITIGIVANKSSGSKEVIDKIKKMFLELPIWMQANVEVWNKTQVEFDTRTRILADVPSSDSFRGFTVNVVYVDECAYIPLSDWEAFSDSIFPTMNSLSFKQTILTSTANGMNHWYHIVNSAKTGKNGFEFIENDWREVPRYDKQGKLLSPEEYKIRTIRKHGKKYFAQTEENEFLGSADTLLSTEALKSMIASEPKNTDMFFNGLNIYEEPIEGHSYIIGVDPAKDGIDSFAVQIIDITKFPFKQVVSAKLDIDYLVMPEHLDTLGKYYNNAFMTIENNEGAGQSIVDILYYQYEYENLYRDRSEDDKTFKKYAGFRTTLKSRPLVINLMKILIEERKLIVQDKETINEFYTFIKSEKITEKYAADEGYHDDLVMALAIALAPFKHIKQYDDLGLFLQSVHAEFSNENDSPKTEDYYSMIADSIGFADEEIDGDFNLEELTDMALYGDEYEAAIAIRNMNRRFL